MNASDFHAIRGMSVGGRTIGQPSKELSDFLREHGLAEPVRVEYRPHASAEMANCFRNVEAQVQKVGGKMETGWAFFELVGISIHTVAHAIWITRFDKRVDITPWRFPPGRDQILFVPDERVAIKRGYTAGLRTVLSKDARIRAMEFFEGEVDKIFDECFVGMGHYMDIPMSRFQEAAERHGLPWEVAKERVDYAFRNHGH